MLKSPISFYHLLIIVITVEYKGAMSISDEIKIKYFPISRQKVKYLFVIRTKKMTLMTQFIKLE